jgi:hypothetical protein
MTCVLKDSTYFVIIPDDFDVEKVCERYLMSLNWFQ